MASLSSSCSRKFVLLLAVRIAFHELLTLESVLEFDMCEIMVNLRK